MTSPLVRGAELVALAVVPLVALVIGLATFADQDRIALDFHEELYPQAEASWTETIRIPRPTPTHRRDERDLADRGRASRGPADRALARGGRLGRDRRRARCLVARSVVLDVRDWRVYGVTLLWPSVIDAYQTANVTLPLALAASRSCGGTETAAGSPASRSVPRWR